MSALPMYRTCVKCGKMYSYNPSIGDLGIVCPYCHAPQTPTGLIRNIFNLFNRK